MRSPHADYLAAPEAHRWDKPLEALLDLLVELSMKGRGAWIWYVLPGGALVSMRLNEADFHRELRIARKAPLGSPAMAEAWAREVSVFLKHFGGLEKFEEVASVPGKADITFRMLLRGEHRGQAEKCAHCGQPAEKGPYREPVCTSCATRLGAEEAAARNARA